MSLRSRFRRSVALVAFACAFATVTASQAGQIEAVEFHHAAFDHYFVTADAVEIGKLDSGAFVGWQRTGLSFKVLEPTDTSPGALPVCRFYGLPAAGLDSHFYSASAVECNEVKQKFPDAWLFESANVFEVYLPDQSTGQCAANTVPVYRSWNNRIDSNHRYTTSASVHDAMIAKGYVAEGYGPGRPVAMCAPTAASALPPSCVLSASSTVATAGASVLLTTNCTGAPTSYAWSGCTSTGPSCTVSSNAAGTLTYGVVATNANGPGATATVQVTWTTPPPPPPPETPPSCGLVVTAQHATPTVGRLIVLEASCGGGDATAFQWTNCVSSTNVCHVRGNDPGLQTYSVTASNAGGSSLPATANVNWVASDAPPLGLCGQFPTTLYSEMGSSNVTARTLYAESPAFAWNGAWAIRFTVPPTAHAGQGGYLTVVEYGAPATYREITVSSTACDFRATDLSGQAGPLGRANSNTAFMGFGIGASTPGTPGLQPGGTYWLSVRNFYPENGSITCPSSPGRCDASASISLPR